MVKTSITIFQEATVVANLVWNRLPVCFAYEDWFIKKTCSNFNDKKPLTDKFKTPNYILDFDFEFWNKLEQRSVVVVDLCLFYSLPLITP